MALERDAVLVAESLSGCSDLSKLAVQGSTVGFDMTVSGWRHHVLVHMMDPGTAAQAISKRRSVALRPLAC